MRLDKLLSNLGYGSRSEIKKFFKQSIVTVNGKKIKKSDIRIDPENDEIIFNGEKISYRKFIYLMMNKPKDVVSATFDNLDKTVIDLLDDKYKIFNPFPVGRLDKDTEGLLVITNNGKLSHRVLSPKKHIPKKYFAIINKEVTKEDIEKFSKGVDIGDGYITKPALLEILGNNFEIYITISEGKFHQVKRMFNAVGKEVKYLKRISMGALELDKDLNLGEYRELTKEEVEMLERKFDEEKGYNRV